MLTLTWTRKAGPSIYYEAHYEGLVVQVEKDQSTGYGYWQVWQGEDRIACNRVSGGINKTKKSVTGWIEQNKERVLAETAKSDIVLLAALKRDFLKMSEMSEGTKHIMHNSGTFGKIIGRIRELEERLKGEEHEQAQLPSCDQLPDRSSDPHSD